MSFLGTLGSALGIPTGGGAGNVIAGLLTSPIVSGVGSGLAGISQAKAQNRGAQLQAMMAQDQMKMAEQAARTNQVNALMKQIHAMNYVSNDGDGNTSPTKTLTLPSGKTLTMDSAYTSPQDVQMAKTILPELNQELATPPTYSNYSSVMKPGAGETALGWLGALTGGIGGATQQKQQNDFLQKLFGQVNQPAQSAQPTTDTPDLTSGNYW